MIKANVTSDDGVMTVDFDATNWFENATNEEIQSLIDCGFGGDYAADTVAEYEADNNNDVKKFFEVLSLQSGLVENVGFECHVDIDDAINWLKKNKNEYNLKTKENS